MLSHYWKNCQLQVFSSLFRVFGGAQMHTYLPSAFWVSWKFYGHLYCTPDVAVEPEVVVDPPVVDPPVVEPPVVEPPVVDPPVIEPPVVVVLTPVVAPPVDPVEVPVVPVVVVVEPEFAVVFQAPVVNPVTWVLLSPQNFTSTNEQWHSLHLPSIHSNPSGHFAQFPWFMK